MITPAAAISDSNLLGLYFAGDSWDAWRAVLKAAYAEPLTPAELALFRGLTGDRDPPKYRVRELIVIAGRRSGKDSIASAIATAAAVADYRQYLRPGERATVACLAVDRQQARIIQRYVAGYFREVPVLTPFLARETEDGLELTNRVEIAIATNSFRSIRGRTIACAILDELAFWRDETSANPDVETYNAILPAMVTLPGALMVVITTAYRKGGLAYQKWHDHFGRNDPSVLVIHAPSTALNPNLPQSVIDAALARDYEAAAAEWLSVWRSDLSDFLDRELISSAVDAGVAVRAPQQGVRYKAFADPSGGRGDAFTMAIAHAEGGIAVLDLLFERRAPFDADQTINEIADLLPAYRVREVMGDNYGAELTVAAFKRCGIAYKASDLNRSQIYLNALPLFTSGRARLLDNPRLAAQFAALERRTTRSGRDTVDHTTGAHDDLANAAAGALVLVAAGKGTGTFFTNQQVAALEAASPFGSGSPFIGPFPSANSPYGGVVR
jgi:hypothetical protein